MRATEQAPLSHGPARGHVARTGGAYLYKIHFDDPSIVIERIRAHGDKGVDAMASIIRLAGEGVKFQFLEIEPHQENGGIGFSVIFGSKTAHFQERVFWYQGTNPPLEKPGKSSKKNLFLIPHEHLKKAGSWQIGNGCISWSRGMVAFYYDGV